MPGKLQSGELISTVEIGNSTIGRAFQLSVSIRREDGKAGRVIFKQGFLTDFPSYRQKKFEMIHYQGIEPQRLNGGYLTMDNDCKLEVSHRKRNDFLSAIDDLVI